MKFCILTGGSKGLGKELLAKLDRDGWVVYELSRSGNSVNNIHCDLGDLESVNATIQTLSDRIAGENISEAILICNASQLGPIKRVKNLSKREIEQSISVNITSQVEILNAFISKFRHAKIKKSIFNISSGAASKGYAGWSLYCMGKAAVENYLHAIYEEEKSESDPFRVVSINPFVMDTQMQRQIRDSDESEFPAKARFIKLNEDNLLIAPDVVASAIIDLVSAADFKEFKFGIKEYLESANASK